MDLITERLPPANRIDKCTGTHERHFSEGAVMLAFAMHLLEAENFQSVTICPDGEHGKQFDFVSWLAAHGFSFKSRLGTTNYGGIYEDVAGRELIVNPKSGSGDVFGVKGDLCVVAECKGGIVNTSHSGQKSRLDKGLCEAVGRLMKLDGGGRQIAVVPKTAVTQRLAASLIARCQMAGIEIALVGEAGEVEYARHIGPAAGVS